MSDDEGERWGSTVVWRWVAASLFTILLAVASVSGKQMWDHLTAEGHAVSLQRLQEHDRELDRFSEAMREQVAATRELRDAVQDLRIVVAELATRLEDVEDQ